MKGLDIGKGIGHWEFKQVENSFPDFTYYEMLFREKAHSILKKHGLL